MNKFIKQDFITRRNRINYYQSPDVSFVLENFECHSADEYPVLGEEDGVTVPPLACRFCPVPGYRDYLAIADENGFVILYNTAKRTVSTEAQAWPAHNNAIFDIAWMWTEPKLLTASGDSTVSLWDALCEKRLDVFKGHTGSIKSVSFRCQDNSVFATGSRDGNIVLWDRRCNKKDGFVAPVSVIKNAHCLPLPSGGKHRRRMRGRGARTHRIEPQLDSQQSVTAVLFQTDNLLVSAGTADGRIKVWDLRRSISSSHTDIQPLHILPYSGTSLRKHGFSSLSFDSTRTWLFASCTDDTIYQYDCSSYTQWPVHCYRGYHNSTFYVKSSICPLDQYLISGSSDNNAYIWKIGHPEQTPVLLQGHSSEVTVVNWHTENFTRLASISDDNTLRIWRLNRRMTPANFGELVGTAQKSRKTMGVSTGSQTDLALASPRTPSSRLINPLTPSTSPRITGMSPRIPFSTPSPCSSKGLSIKEWFRRGAGKSPITDNWKSPTKGKSPRKLIISPQKPEASNFNSVPGPCATSAMRTPERGSSTLTESHVKACMRLSCKRKLVDDSPEQSLPSPRKKRLLSDGVSFIDHKILSPIRIPFHNYDHVISSPKHLTNDSDIPVPSEVPRCDTVFKSPGHCTSHATTAISSPLRISIPSTFNSPTANLPNLVLDDTDQRHCLSRHDSDKENHTMHRGFDWLTRKRLDHLRVHGAAQNNDTESDSSQYESSQDCDSAGQKASPLKPMSPVPGVRSIMTYFKPKSMAP